MTSRILVLTQSGDATAEVVIRKLRRDGSEVIVFDTAWFPVSAKFVVSLDGPRGVRRVISFGDFAIDLASVDAVWVRRPGNPVADRRVANLNARTFVEQECGRFLDDVWHGMPCVWVPARPAHLALADLRLSQLQLAQEIGLETPLTVATNDPDVLLDFYQRRDGDIVSKLVAQTIDYTQFMRYTDIVAPNDVACAGALRYAPALFQCYVHKQIELRLTVVGTRIYAAEIDSQGSHRARDDWRRYDYDRTPYRPHNLPEQIGAACIRLIKQFGLTFGTIDMILTPEGKYVFLELNPTGQWYWIEQLTGLSISDGLCELLTSRSPQLQWAREDT